MSIKKYTNHSSKGNKYESDYCDIVYFPGDSITSLRDSYHSEMIPDFIQDLLLHIPDSIDRKIINQCPELFSWTCNNDYFIRPNIPKYQQDDLLTDFGSSWRRNNELHLIAWYIPSVLYPSIMTFFDKNHRLSNKKIFEVERNINHEFLATPLDLEPRHLCSLTALRSLVLNELQNTYGLKDPNVARLYFHIYNMPEYASLHLQIRYNTTLHPAEEPRTFDLDQVIDWLSEGRSVLECLADENRKAYFFEGDNPNLMRYLEKVPGSITYRGVENPFKKRRSSHFVHSQVNAMSNT